MTNYARADTQAAWYQDNFPGATMKPNCGVIHTTEGTTLPGYSGGAVAPNYTAVPDFTEERLRWFAHFPDEKSSRALVNLSGGVETNTANAVQVELVGTCAPASHRAWKSRHIFWPEPPDWALQDLARFLVDMQRRHQIPLEGPPDAQWVAYPESYGSGGQRFTSAHWRAFKGWCGHQHVPENVHGDPGNFPWSHLERMARDLSTQAAKPNVKPDAPNTPRWDRIWELAHHLAGQEKGEAAKAARAIQQAAHPHSAEH